MMEFGSMSQPFRVGPDMSQPFTMGPSMSQPLPPGSDCTNYALPDYFGRVENSHLPGYNLNNDPYIIPETFAHRPDPEAYDYYTNLNAKHKARETDVSEFNANYLSFMDKTPTPILIDPPLIPMTETYDCLPISPALLVDMSVYREDIVDSIHRDDTSGHSVIKRVYSADTDFDFSYLKPKEKSAVLAPLVDMSEFYERKRDYISEPVVVLPLVKPVFIAEPVYVPLTIEPAFSPRIDYVPKLDYGPKVDFAPRVDYFPVPTYGLPIENTIKPENKFDTFLTDYRKPLAIVAEPVSFELTKPVFVDYSVKIIEDTNMMIADIVARRDKEVVFGGYGNSHFSYVDVKNEGWHVTTQIPGFGKREGFDMKGLSLHDPIIF